MSGLLKVNVPFVLPKHGKYMQFFRLRTLTQTLLLMKLTVIIVFAACLQLSAEGYGQKISLQAENVDLANVFQEIRKQTGYQFLYNDQHLRHAKKITIHAQNASLDKVLRKCFQAQPLTYRVVDRTIVVQPLEEKKADPVYRLSQKAQIDSIVHGNVTDTTGAPLPGVSVLIRGTNTGTSTGMDGNYSLKVDGPEAVLVFSFLGYKTLEVQTNGRSEISVTLKEDIADLDQIVVVGYGTARKSDLTGAVARVEAEDFKRQQVTQLTEMLSGTVPGFYSRQSASPSGGGSMEIRGQNSLSAQTDPMVVLDGVIFNGSLQEINPADIESIDILKDASSAAIFGARAAAGVILVTTKKGVPGEPRINFSSKVGFSSPTKARKPLGPEEYLQFRQDFFTEGILNDPSTSRYYYTNPNNLPPDISVEEWLHFRNSPHSDPITEWTQRLNLFTTEQENYLEGKTVDWYGLVMNSTALRQNYDLSVSGGTEKIKYYWSLGYLDNEGLVTGDRYSALQTRLNMDAALSDWLNVGLNAQFTNRDEGAVPANLTRMYTVSPYGNFREEDGSLTPYPHEYVLAVNPMADYYGRERNRKINSLFASLYTNIKLPFGFNYKFSFQPRLSYADEHIFDGPESVRGLSLPQGAGSRANEKIYEWMIDNLLTWNQTFGRHALDFTFLYNVEEYQRWYNIQSNQNFAPNQNLGFHGLQFGDNPSLDNIDQRQTGDALMARINYTLSDKYLFTASLRRDGYSAFGQEQPYAVFPAFAFAWKLSDEGFFNNHGLVNRLKLRLSWGVNGNRDIGAYSALSAMRSIKAYDGSNVIVGVESSNLANPSLVWEKTTSLNFGTDIGLLEDRIDLSLDFYVGRTTDLLLDRLLPIITGFTNVTSNLGELKNQGFELTANTVNVNTAKFSWRSNLAFSFNRNEIVSLFGDTGPYTLLGDARSGELPDFSNEWFPGHAVDAVWNYKLLGIWQEEEAEEAARYNMSPGDFKGEDVNNDGRYIDVEDKQFIGYTVPRFLIGLRNSFEYGPFGASVFIRADLGHLIPYNQALGGSLTHDRMNYNNGRLPYWTPENRNNRYPRLRPINTAYGGGLGFYEPGSFVRIQDVSVSYSVPQSVYSRLRLRAMSLYLSGRNLVTFDNFIGWDPETGSDPETVYDPMPRTVTVGIDISL